VGGSCFKGEYNAPNGATHRLASSLDDGQQWNDRRVPVVSSLDATSHDPSIVAVFLVFGSSSKRGNDQKQEDVKGGRGSARKADRLLRVARDPKSSNDEEDENDEVRAILCGGHRRSTTLWLIVRVPDSSTFEFRYGWGLM
jgi:hypothetical protein